MSTSFSPGFRLAALMALMSLSQTGGAAITAGGLAIVGYDDYADTFKVMALDDIGAGETVYFTNNGWNNSLDQFNGADVDQGSGNESIIKLTITGTIARGTVFSSSMDTASLSWARTGLIPGQSPGGMATFSDLALEFESDQIYAFQGAFNNPLLNPTSFIYALHFGSVDYPGFSDSEDTLTGAVPTGLSEAAHTAFAHTDFSFHGTADGFHSVWQLNMDATAIANLTANGGTKDQWLTAIADSSNWGNGPQALEAMPEPSRALLVMIGLGAIALRRRRILGC